VAAPRRSVLAMAVLSMLGEAPMHAYRMQQLIKERHKDDVVNVGQRNSVYQTVQRLLRDGLVEVGSTERNDNRPERTTYRITPAGRETLSRWLRDMLATPAAEYPEFPAALAFLPVLPVADVLTALGERVTAVRTRLEAAVAENERARSWLAPVFLVESDYQERMWAAELDHLQELIADLRSGRITWP
jgi:DNA-binding PadR family transcriptional regulator